ncbi:MAG: hypothetical protein PW786_02135 [Arachidicoccus sp.]|nr:hypothetical protein [Arachidicoccus sp.]
MRKYLIIFTSICIVALSCNKDSFTNNANAYLYADLPAGGDTLSFDTVFTSVSSVTKFFLIKNIDSKSIHINDIQLAGGENSFFKINVNGTPGTNFHNIDLAAGDSMYVFVTVNITPDSNTNPFVIQDSISYSWNGNIRYVQLKATGRNAIFISSQTTIQHDTAWTNKLPIVLLGNFTIDKGATLTIQKGTKIYLHAKTIFQINGTLIANGESDTADRILFTGDRLDDPYYKSPNQWRGINIGEASTGNILNNVTIKNAYIGIADTLNIAAQSPTRLSLSNCIITNHSYAAIYFRNTNAIAINSLISNSNVQTVLENGGKYSFNYCTIAGYGNEYVQHINPSVIIQNNSSAESVNSLTANFTNSIIYGDQSQNDELLTNANNEANFSININYCIYKLNSSLTGVSFSNSIQNSDPLFITTDYNHDNFNFNVEENSPAVGSGIPNSVTTDITGQPRDATKPTIGCYEFKE